MLSIRWQIIDAPGVIYANVREARSRRHVVNRHRDVEYKISLMEGELEPSRGAIVL